MTKRMFFLALCIAALFPAFLSAQTAQEIEDLLAVDTVSYSQAAALILRAADLGVAGEADAFTYASEQNWLPRNAAPGDAARLSGVSLLIMESFGLRGGIFYSLAKNPHYAYRELVYRGIIMGRADPSMTVSGDLLLFLVSRVLSQTESDSQLPVEEPASVSSLSREYSAGYLPRIVRINGDLS